MKQIIAPLVFASLLIVVFPPIIFVYLVIGALAWLGWEN